MNVSGLKDFRLSRIPDDKANPQPADGQEAWAVVATTTNGKKLVITSIFGVEETKPLKQVQEMLNGLDKKMGELRRSW